MNKDNLPLAIFLMGPTASGKTELAVQLAKKLNTEIISVDSTLVYKGMDIGTAKPSMEERRGIPHHLIDILEPSEVFSTGHFRKQAFQLMKEISSRGKTPILVGGTMLYFNSLLIGLANLPEADLAIRKKLEKELETHGKQAIHARLKTIDPDAAQRIHPNDPQRVQRALEVFEISGKPMTEFFHEAKQNELPFKKIKFIVAPENRGLLHEKIAIRFKQMVDLGLIDEVEGLYQRSELTEQYPAARAVGYRQVRCFLQDEYDQEMMIEKGIIATRQLAKRQYTWLRRVQDATQLISFEKKTCETALQTIEHHL